MYTSETMSLCQLQVNGESAYDCMSALGKKNSTMIIDLNKGEQPSHRQYYHQVRRCEDIERTVENIILEMNHRGIKIEQSPDIDEFDEHLQEIYTQRNKTAKTFLDDFETEIHKQRNNIETNINKLKELNAQLSNYIEYCAILKECKEVLVNNNFFKVEPELRDNESLQQQNYIFDEKLRIGYVAGVIKTEDITKFKKIVFRVTRGGSYFETKQMDVPGFMIDRQRSQLGDDYNLAEQQKDAQSKSVFMILFTTGKEQHLTNKIQRIAESFQCQKYALPQTLQGFNQLISTLDTDMLELNNTCLITENQVKEQLKKLSEKRKYKNRAEKKGEIDLNYEYYRQQNCSLIEEQRLICIREKMIWQQMNNLVADKKIFQGLFWCPTENFDSIKKQIEGLQYEQKKDNIDAIIELEEVKNYPKHITPPTYFKINEVTWPFQEIVNTYGIPRYKEINPGLFAVSMFPFKFGVMFGDIGHGGILFSLSLFLCLRADHLRGTIFEPLLFVRYLFLLMGAFALYSGFIYNDFFSLTFNFFGSCFEEHGAGQETSVIKECVYLFGIDPKWFIAKNELQFINSFKMKVAVIIGVLQMLFGVILKGLNCIQFGLLIDFLFEFIPQLCFLTFTFGYMVFLIIFKWTIDFSPDSVINPNTGEWLRNDYIKASKAPSIINQMINLPLRVGSTENLPLWNKEQQEWIQFILLIGSLICVPWMLFPKPFLLLFNHTFLHKGNKGGSHGADDKLKNDDGLTKALMEKGQQNVELTQLERQSESKALKKELKKPVSIFDRIPKIGGHGHGDEFEFSEIFVHQVIETIEYVLGCISNTASYLRLWALSLAHSQLSKVFFVNTIGGGIVTGNIVKIIVGWCLWLNITFGVIMGMDLMECFLVEFQNKFFKADGYKFNPYSFKSALCNASGIFTKL